MNVLSLFDGMSCGHLALDRAGIGVDMYFASEINHDAIKVTYLNYPETIEIGPVEGVFYENRIEAQAGFLCSKHGYWKTDIDLLIGGSPCQGFSQASSDPKGLKDPRSKLFWEYVRIKNECKPKWWLLENVRMDKYSMDVISEALDVEPTLICSSKFLPQLRKRLYWTNIPIPPLPQSRELDLCDILTDGYTDRTEARCILESESRPNTDKRRLFRRYRKIKFINLVFEREDLCPLYVRSLNQTELEFLQGVPEGYTRNLSRNRAASLLGNGWTVPVISHIFEGMLSGEEYVQKRQLRLFS